MSVQLLSVGHVATRLGVHEDTVRRMIARGDLTAIRVARCVRISEEELEAYVHSQHPGAVASSPAPERASDGQIRALHAKCSELDRRAERPARSTKKAILTMAGAQFGREVTSSLELSSREAHWALETLDTELDQL